MIPMTLAEIAGVVRGDLHNVPDPAAVVTAPSTVDSREVVPGGLFVATVGARADGHDYAAKAVADGAAGVLGTKAVDAPAILVDDVEVALGLLAKEMLGRIAPIVVGLTGSVGKTTTKDLIAQILERHAPTVATAKSFNNELGLPLTVLRADATTRYLVLEMGAGRPGDLTYLTGLAPPHLGLVLNVGSTHLMTMGGGLETVAATKGELVEALPADGYALLDTDDPLVAAMASRTRATVLWFGSAADVRAGDVRLDEHGMARFELITPGGSAPVTLRLIGAHQVRNAVAAAAVAVALEIPADAIAAGLSQAERRSSGRMEVTERTDGITVVNDAYNANPQSMAAALRALAAMSGDRRTIAVLGEMTGQAEHSRDKHAAIGRLAGSLGIDVLVAVGEGDPAAMAEGAREHGQDTTVHTAPDQDAATTLVTGLLQPGDVVLLKASSDASLMRCVAALTS